MKTTAWGVMALVSTFTFACTTTIETRSPDEAPKAHGAAPASAGGASMVRLKLALSSRARKAASILAGKHDAQGPAHVLSGTSTDAGANACGLSTGDPTCDACLDSSCCAQTSACTNDADCSALIACGDACTDDACFQACFTAHPSGASLLDAASSCMDASCRTACGGPGPDPGPGPSACGFGSGDATCDACLDGNCCADANACIGDADCTALLDCEQNCGDAACVTACESAHPTGAPMLAAISACANNTCGTACAGAGSSGTDGGVAATSCGLTSGDATCDACLDGSCCAPTTSCLGDAECVALIQCYDACNDDTCAAACDTAHPGGKASLGAVMTCVQASCTTACGL